MGCGCIPYSITIILKISFMFPTKIFKGIIPLLLVISCHQGGEKQYADETKMNLEKVTTADADSTGSVQQGNTEGYAHIIENNFLAAAQNPLSTFSIDVDDAA